MAPKNQQPKETSTPLIITMIFFILLSIGLGVATYYGFAEQTALKAAKTKADSDAKKANEERDFYRYQAWQMRAYIGFPFEGVVDENEVAKLEGDDKKKEYRDGIKIKASDQMKSGRDNLNNGKLGTGLSDERKRELEEFKTVLKDKIDQPTKCGTWNAEQGTPQKTYEKLIEEQKAEIARIQTELKDREDKLKAAQAAQLASAESLKMTQDKYAADYKTLSDDFQKKINEKDALAKKYLDDLKTFTAKRPDDGAKYTKMVDDANKERALFAKENKDLKDQVSRLQSRLESKEEQKPVNAKILGEVVSVQVNGKKAFINLGSAHGLKPQQTFAVFALDPNGKPRPDPKASVEVVNVVKERLSEVIITTMYSKDRDPYTDRLKQIGVGDAKNIDPVVKGDVLINPVWNPDAKIHIAISGVIDLKGDGFDNMDAFIRSLEKQNVIVDAYIDTRDMSIKGSGISQKTDYLVVGSQPFAIDPSGRSKKAENLEKKMDEMRVTAQKYGLATKKATRFLEETGYRLEKRIED